MGKLVRYSPEIFQLFVVALAHLQLAVWLLRTKKAAASPAARMLAAAAVGLSFLFVTCAITSQVPRIWGILPRQSMLIWLRGVALAWGFCLCGSMLVAFVLRGLDRIWPGAWPGTATEMDPGRRALLRSAGTAAMASPFIAAGFGVFIQRTDIRLREVDLKVPGLPHDLDGLRIAQLSDMHVGPFLSPAQLRQAVELANETKPHLTVVTGDLITTGGDPLDACLSELARLRADAGLFGCMGNHEIYANSLGYTEREGALLGLRFLRGGSHTLRFGSARLNLGGVDYQPMRTPYLVNAAQLLSREEGTFNLLLSHNPDVFPAAARQGWDAVLAGHTHGGQVSVEFLHQHLNVARFFTPYTYGLYSQGRSSIYVTRGIGTVGVPARIGAPPEIALIKLCAT